MACGVVAEIATSHFPLDIDAEDHDVQPVDVTMALPIHDLPVYRGGRLELCGQQRG